MFTRSQQHFINLIEAKFGSNYTISRQEILDIQNENDVGYPLWLTKEPFKISRGMFKVPSNKNPAIIENVVPMKKPTIEPVRSEYLVPERDPNFEKYGFYNDLKNIIKSKRFYPIFISGPSGIGKTFLVEQVCAELKRECIRVNFSIETDQTDLIGGPTLVDGNITYSEGPVITCLRNGYVLLLDEIDRSNANNILILNGILEGRGFYNPKTGEFIKAKEGFNIITTANSKGYGDESGKYLSQILDSAFLERFPITLEQEFPSDKVETKILKHHSQDEDFVDKLVKWARVIRKTYENGGIDEIISTRRLVHICEAHVIFGDKLKAINLCVSRFESHTKEAFVDLYTKIDANALNLDDDGNVVESEYKEEEKQFPNF
jgi:hypothetical protein